MRRIPLPPALASALAPGLALARWDPSHAADPATANAVTTSSAIKRRLDCLPFMSPPVSRILCPGRFDDSTPSKLCPPVPPPSLGDDGRQHTPVIGSPHEPAIAAQPAAPRARSPHRPFRHGPG